MSSLPTTALRSPGDWAAVFQSADSRPYVVCQHGRPTGEYQPSQDIQIWKGACVTMRPNGTRRDDVSLGDKVWYAKAVNTCYHAHYGNCVRLRWYYTRDEILDLHFRAPLSFFNKIVYALGRNELLSGTHLTGALANRIDGLVHIEEYEPSTISFPIVDRNTLYCRLDVRLEVVHGQESPRWVQGSFTPICTHRCTQDGLYSPDHDVLRYCYRCKTWFHVDCMALSQATLPTHPSYENDRPAQPELPADLNSDKMMPGHGFTAYEYSLWCRLLNLPIQRRYHEHRYPLSFELVLCFIRSHDRTHGCPQNVHDFILHRMTFALAETLSPQIMSYFGILINMPPATFFYTCPACHDDI